MFTPFKIRSWFGAKDPIPAGLRSRVIYKFSCAGCNACYIGDTNRHFATRISEHLASDKHSHIFKHLRGSENCRSLCSEDCFKILDSASTRFQLKIKEAMHILWEQPSLNCQVKHLNLSLSYLLVSFLSLNSLFCFFVFWLRVFILFSPSFLIIHVISHFVTLFIAQLQFISHCTTDDV